MTTLNSAHAVDFPLLQTGDALRVLVVDDDPVFCRALEAVGAAWGFEVVGCSSTREVYRLLPTFRFHVAVVDYSLGLVTGIQLARFIQRFHARAPVVLVSDYLLRPKDDWPDSIKSFVQKEGGAKAIFLEVRRLFSQPAGSP